MAELVRQVAARTGRATIGDPGASPWLFPVGQPARPISAFRQAERLNQLGILLRTVPLRRTVPARHQPAAAPLASMLGVHISVAVAWQRASSGDWAAYAADLNRRADH